MAKRPLRTIPERKSAVRKETVGCPHRKSGCPATMLEIYRCCKASYPQGHAERHAIQQQISRLTGEPNEEIIGYETEMADRTKKPTQGRIWDSKLHRYVGAK